MTDEVSFVKFFKWKKCVSNRYKDGTENNIDIVIYLNIFFIHQLFVKYVLCSKCFQNGHILLFTDRKYN